MRLGEAFEGFLGSGEIANSASVDIPSLFKSCRDSVGYLPTGENPARSLSGCTRSGGFFDKVIVCARVTNSTLPFLTEASACLT
jgi:hypothetical protein